MAQFDYDVIVVGAGHAGIEASLAPARLGLKTLCVTTKIDRIGYMSCNPAIGGLAKGHMVREIDVLGGEMGRATDKTCIQFKRLNSNRGPAVRGSRTQCDKELYAAYMQKTLKEQPNLDLRESEVKSLILHGHNCVGVKLADSSEIYSRTVVITTGTFMNGVMHMGLEQTPGGRVGDAATVGLSDQLRSFGFTVQRLKTGTPARLDKNSIDWSKTEPQWGDKKFYPFSFKSARTPELPQVACYLSYTNEKTHEIIRKNIHKSPMYCGIIEGTGPRYCPSIEDKITRFADRNRHQTFLEPESLSTNLIYLQGISTSLPVDVQDMFLRTISGLENVKVIRYGYAIEYDFIEPTQIQHSLETRGIDNLFLAGQVNGTSGYEEAAAQGFVAGVNAARKVLGQEPLILQRHEAYIGVLIDDLVTKGTKEPYRMFTSRAEHRLVLREDNTIDRLLPVAQNLSLHNEGDFSRLVEISEQRRELKNTLNTRKLVPNESTLSKLRELGTAVINKPISYADLLRRSDIDYFKISQFDTTLPTDELISEAVEIDVKYHGYVARQDEMINQAKRLESLKIPLDIIYDKVHGLSAEEIEKLSQVRPSTLGQAERVSGINPSAVQALLIHIKGREFKSRSL